MKKFTIKVQGIAQLNEVEVEAEAMAIDKDCVILNDAAGFTVAIFPVARVVSAVAVTAPTKR